MKSLSFLLVTLVACAGTKEEPVKPFGPTAAPSASKPPSSGDVSVDLPAIEIKGAVYEPKALGQPGMPLVDPKKPIPLEKQRDAVKAAKDPVQKQAQAAVLATMLYRESKAKKDNEKALLTDARQGLRDVATEVGDKAIDELTLRLLGSYELLFDDYPAAEKAWAKLVELERPPAAKDKDKDTKIAEAAENRAYLAYSLLKQFKNPEALAALGKDYKPDEKHPELAYVAAWAKWRAKDGAGALAAINAASKGWGQNPNREVLEQDVLLIAGRSGTSVDEAVAVINAMPGKAKLQQYELVARLGLSGYGRGGRWADGIATLEKAVGFGGGTVPPNDLPVIRANQAEFTVPLDAPDAALKYAKQAVESLGPCGAKCTDKDKADIVQRTYLLGRLFHILYATANDQRYYQPAYELYAVTIPMLDAATKAQAQKDAKSLETTLRNTKVGSGTHDKGALGVLLSRHNAEVEACYEAALSTNTKLGGSIGVTLESDATGAIKGVATEPKAGLEGVSAVAGCIAEHAKTWRLPKRGLPGNTRVKLSYALSLKKQ